MPFSFDTCKGAAARDTEILRDNILRKGQAAAILYRNGEIDGELFALQTATALSIGKPFGGFFPARPLKVCIVGHRRDHNELGEVCDTLEDYWKSAGWTDEEVKSAIHSTRFIDRNGKTGDSLVAEIQSAQDETPFDLIIGCNLADCFGDDPAHPSAQSFARFLKTGLGSIQSGAHPCATLGIIGVEDGDNAIRNFLDETSVLTELLEGIDNPEATENRRAKVFASTIGRAIGEWARSVFALGYAHTERGGCILALVAIRTEGRLLWCCPNYGEGAIGHALRARGCHFEEVHLENLPKEKRAIVEENYSCADTLEIEI